MMSRLVSQPAASASYPRLLRQFAQRRLGHRLAPVDMPARIAPEPRIRRVAAAHQQDVTLVRQHRERGEFRSFLHASC